jgi:hypothetical protein
VATFIFGVFIVYAVRFFYNNWVYLSESYHRESLKDQPEHYLLTVLRCAHFDLSLSIITGASCAFAGTLLNEEGKHLFGILVLLIFHYTSDLLLLGHNYWARRKETDSGLSPKVVFWLLNNAMFVAIFTYFVINLLPDATAKANYMFPFSVLWLINSVIALGLTAGFSHLETREARRFFKSNGDHLPVMARPASNG